MKQCHLLYKSTTNSKASRTVFSSIGKRENVERFKMLLNYVGSNRKPSSISSLIPINDYQHMDTSIQPTTPYEQHADKRSKSNSSHHRALTRSDQSTFKRVYHHRNHNSGSASVGVWKKVSYYYKQSKQPIRKIIPDTGSTTVINSDKQLVPKQSITELSSPEKRRFEARTPINPIRSSRSPIGKCKEIYQKLKNKINREIDFITNRDLEIPQVADVVEWTVGCICSINKNKLIRSESDKQCLRRFINSLHVFKDKDPKFKEDVISLLKLKKYWEGDKIYSSGASCNKAMLLCVGSIERIGKGRSKILNRGCIIGEKKFYTDKLVNSEYCAKENSWCILIEKEDVDAYCSSTNDIATTHYLISLSMCELFSTWANTRLAGLLKYTTKEIIPRNTIIYNIGEPPSSIYALEKGAIKIEVLSYSDTTHNYPVGNKKWEMSISRRSVLSIAKYISNYQLFGYEEIMRMEKRESVATAMEESTIFKIDAAQFKNALTQIDSNQLLSKSCVDSSVSSDKIKDLAVENQLKKQILYDSIGTTTSSYEGRPLHKLNSNLYHWNKCVASKRVSLPPNMKILKTTKHNYTYCDEIDLMEINSKLTNLEA